MRKMKDSKLGFEVGSGLKKSQSKYNYEAMCKLYGEKEEMKLGIVGSRRRISIKDKELIRNKIIELKPTMLVSGGCLKGADKFTEELAKEFNLPITIFKPKFTGKEKHFGEVVARYYARNKKIADYSTHLIALVSKDRKGGTENTIEHFKKYDKEKNLEIL